MLVLMEVQVKDARQPQRSSAGRQCPDKTLRPPIPGAGALTYYSIVDRALAPAAVPNPNNRAWTV